MTNSVDG